MSAHDLVDIVSLNAVRVSIGLVALGYEKRNGGCLRRTTLRKRIKRTENALTLLVGPIEPKNLPKVVNGGVAFS